MSEERYCLKGTRNILRQEKPGEGVKTPSRHTRWPLIIIGGVLLGFQVISILVGAKFGGCPWQEPYFLAGQAFWRDLLRLVYYLPSGIIGAVLVILALPKKQILIAGCVAATIVLAVGGMAYTGTAKAEQEQTAIAQALASAKYVASSKEDTVHRAYCKYAGWISSKNMVTYSSLEDALKDGKHPCEECFGDVLNESSGEHASNFLQEKAAAQAEKVDEEYGPDAYGGSNTLSFSEWTILKEYGYIK